MRRPLGMIALFVVVIMMGFMVWADAPPVNAPAEAEAGDTLTVTGCVKNVELRQSYGTEIYWIYLDSVMIHEINTSAAEVDIPDKIICQTGASVRPRIGSYIRVTGQFDLFSQATNPGQFDAARYYQTLGICGMLKKAEISAESTQYSHIKEALYSLREYWKTKLYQIFPEKEASILCAMILGDKTDLDSDIKELYQQNGIIHILSISGLHISLIGMGLYKLLRRLGCPVPVAAPAAGGILVLYGVLTGMGVSTIRAIGMYLIRMLGELLGRTYDMLTALGVMAFVMLAANPLYLEHSGFLLSFGSICGIGIVLPMFGKDESDVHYYQTVWEKLLSKWGRKIFQSILPGISVTLFTLPIQLKLFYEIPVYSILLNLLVLPFMGIVMVVGLVAMMIPGLSFIGFIDVVILRNYEQLCQLFENLPFHTWNPGAPKLWQIVVYYLLLAVCMFLPGSQKRTALQKKPGSQKRHGYRICLMAAAVCIMGLHFPRELTVAFLDVGQGDCICIQTGEETYLFDCGSSSQSSVGENILIPYLKQAGIRKLDGVFVSHPDKDHVSGILELLEIGAEEGIKVEKLILPDIESGMREEEFGELQNTALQNATMQNAAMQERAVPVFYMGKGAVWQSGKVKFTCLHPESGSSLSDSNAYSQCFLIEYGAFSMLLTGDVEGDGEEELYKVLEDSSVQDITFLKVAHHGSKYSTSEEMLELLKPVAAVISCGRDNSYGHPHAELIERLEKAGSRIYQTPETGAVEIRVYRDKVKVTLFTGSQSGDFVIQS